MPVLEAPSRPRGTSPMRRQGPRRALALGAGALVVVGCLALPQSAGAMGFNPITGITHAVGAGIHLITGGVGGAVVAGFGAIIKALFAWPAKLIDQTLLSWLVAVPDYTS